MSSQVLRRFIFLMALLTIASFVFWDILKAYVARPPGDFEVEMGSQRLEDGLYAEALDYYGQALAEMPDHRGALMGRALVFIQQDRLADAEAELDHLIASLRKNLAPDDWTGIGALAAAYANRGIVRDRQGRHEEALIDYALALKTDEDTVDGPGIVWKILHDTEDLSTVRKRAVYLQQQLKLPEEQRVMTDPDLDAKQRMYKP